jgi:GAF domain-containing protein
LTGERISLDDFSLARTVIENGEANQAALPDKQDASKFEQTLKDLGLGTLAVIPLIERDNVLGIFSIGSRVEGFRVSSSDLDLLETLAGQSAIGIQNARLFQQTQEALDISTEQARRLALLNEMSTALGLADDLQQIYDISVEKALEIFKADRVSVATIAPENHLEVKGLSGDRSGHEVGERFQITDSTGEMVIRQNQVKIVSDSDSPEHGSVKSYMVAPISARGTVIGVLDVGSQRADFFHARDEVLLQQLVAILGGVISNQQLFNQVERSLAETATLYNASAELNRSQRKISRPVGSRCWRAAPKPHSVICRTVLKFPLCRRPRISSVLTRRAFSREKPKTGGMILWPAFSTNGLVLPAGLPSPW